MKHQNTSGHNGPQWDRAGHDHQAILYLGDGVGRPLLGSGPGNDGLADGFHLCSECLHCIVYIQATSYY
jgi:hypothetical protein